MNIKKLIGETNAYDKKQALEERRPKSWCKSVSAFANGNGGRLIFGVADEDSITGLRDVRHDSEVISEQIKNRIDPIPKFDLVIQGGDDKEIIVLEISKGLETPYYYVSEGSRTAYQRVGNESIPVDARGLKELILRGSDSTYDSSISRYEFRNYSFTKLKAVYRQRTGESFENDDFISFGIVSEDGKLTNAGALLADESPIRHSRLFCTRWNGLDKAAGTMDALDDKEFSGSLVVLLENGLDFVRTNSKVKWQKAGEERIEVPD